MSPGVQRWPVSSRVSLPSRTGPLRGALAVCEGPRSPAPGAAVTPVARGPLRVLAVGCELLAGPVLEAARAYQGLATVAVAGCGLGPDRPEAHVEEPRAPVVPALGQATARFDALVLPPGAPSRIVAAASVPTVRLELAPACLLDLVCDARGSTAGSVAMLLPADQIGVLLVAALAQYAPDVPVVAYAGLEHLRGQLGLLKRLRPSLVLADPAAAVVAQDAGLAARSIFEGRGLCVVVHALERALARASLARLSAVTHGSGGTGHSEDERLHPAPAAVRRPRGGLDPVRDVLALRTTRRFVLVPTVSISYISSRDGLITAYTDSGSFWTDRTLAEVEARLDPRQFLRVDASRLVNLARVVELVPWTHQRYKLVLADGAKTQLMLSRDVGRRMRAALGW